MFAQKTRQPLSDQFFVSAKTRCEIPVGHPALGDALVLATLDPGVRSISYVGTTEVAGRQVKVSAIVVVRDEGFFHLDVVPARPVRDPASARSVEAALEKLVLPAWTISAADLSMPPRVQNALECWRHRNVQVDIGMRIKVMQALEELGPMSFSHLLESVNSTRDPAPAVLSLACSDLLEIDLVSRPLGPRTIVKSRHRPE
jgi:hypothetical protein